jgi:two-component system CheB/CheR fusion protein
VLERYTWPCVVVDRRLEILYLFGPTGDYLTQPQGEVAGDVLSWVRPELYAKLRAGLAEALEHTRPVTVTGVRLEQDTVAARIEIVIEPVTAGSSGEGLFSIVFRAMPSASRAAAAPGDGDVDSDSMTGQLKQDLEDARTELRTVVGQLRIAGEEHSASYEELLSLNEEFQSANEELEASKEELQSLNEELTTINSQLEEKNEELRTLTSDLNNLLVSTGVATIFLDRELRIRRFTPACSAVVSIGEADLGRALAAVPMRVRDDTVFAHAQRVLAEAPSAESAAESAGVPVDPSVLTAEVSTGDDRWFSRRVLPYRTAAGDVDGVCLTYHEITQQKSAAAESERARHYAEAVIRTSRTPLLVLDRDHRVMSANDAFYSTFRIDRGEAEEERRTLYELADGQWDISRVRTLLDEVVKVMGREVRDYGVDHVFGRIGWRSLRLNAQVMPRDDRPDLILVSIEDVTDLRLAEKVADGRADELTKDDRRKNEFLAMLGHELRNPLSALSHGLELLRGSGGERIEPVREMMERQTRRMTAMLDQLLDVARVISGKFELTRNAADVAEVARAALESVAPMLEAAGHEVSVSLPEEGTVLVQGDEVRLAQVIENLLGNAVKYTQDGGRIELIAEATEETVEITVRDNGIGMAPDELDHMFDLFTQASTSLERAKGGLGLGLPLVRSLVHMHEGEVRASSAGPGQGMEVVVTLPRLRRGRLLAGDSDEPARMPIASRRILVADDEGDTAFALAELLTLKGHQAQAVLDGNAALAAAAEFAPEIALIDLGLPGMDGYELAGRMRELCGEGVHLVAVTGYSEDRDRLREAGFDGHLLKPLALDQLFALVGRLERGA